MAEGLEEEVFTGSPAWRWVGIRVLSAGDGEAAVEMDAREEFRNFGGTVHGGFLCFLADSAMGRALGSVENGAARHATIDLKLNFIDAGQIGETLRAYGKVVHAGSRTAVTECRIEGGDGRLVATASGSFMTWRKKEDSAGAD